MKYYLVYFGEDGLSITPKNEKEMEKFLKDAADEQIDFCKTEASEWSMNYGVYPLYTYMIIKGELVVPRKTEVVTKYEI